jgi:ribonuclease BN (tRNA processing enzyme)
MPSQTILDFLGTSSCRTDIGNDTASFVLNRELMVDTGWCSVENLRTAGIDPVEVPYLLLTHWHHDHYLSLPSILFYHLCIIGDLSHLTILGPAEDSNRVLCEIIPYKINLHFKITNALLAVNISSIKGTMQKSVLLDILTVLILIRKYQTTGEIESYIEKALLGGLLDKKTKKQIELLLEN